jgi:hypothetical protein
MATSAAFNNHASWGDIVRYEEDAEDSVFVGMNRSEFEEEKRLAKNEKRFGTWDDWLIWVERVELKRQVALATPPPPPTLLQQLLHLRSEYIRYPSMHFSCQKSMERELKVVEKNISSCVGGVDALKMMKKHQEDIKSEDSEEEDSIDSDDEFIFKMACNKRK